MKEALIRMNATANQGNDELLKELGENVWSDVSKEMKSIYIKRSGKNGITKAVDVNDIPDLEANSIKSGYTSIAGALQKEGISIKKPVHKDPFENTVIPDGYFNNRRNEKNRASLFVSQKLFFFKKEQCIEMEKGGTWFQGDVLQIKKNKSGKSFYYILINNFKGKKVPVKFWGAIYVKFFEQFGVSENFLNKNLEVILSNNYTVNSSPSFRIKTGPQKIQGDFVSESFEEDEELSEKEIKNLKALDWSQIKCPKK